MPVHISPAGIFKGMARVELWWKCGKNLWLHFLNGENTFSSTQGLFLPHIPGILCLLSYAIWSVRKEEAKYLVSSPKQLLLRMSSWNKLEPMFDFLHNINPERNPERFSGQHLSNWWKENNENTMYVKLLQFVILEKRFSKKEDLWTICIQELGQRNWTWRTQPENYAITIPFLYDFVSFFFFYFVYLYQLSTATFFLGHWKIGTFWNSARECATKAPYLSLHRSKLHLIWLLCKKASSPTFSLHAGLPAA